MQRSVVRCYPLPQEARTATRVKINEDADTLGIEHFVSSRFAEEPELGDVAMRLLRNGDNNAASIIGDFVQASLDRIAAVSA
jgi:hypothetical protein